MAFKSAISAAAAVGNNEEVGRVVVPPGEWETGPLHLKSNVELHLEEGSVLRFSDRIADYLPAVEVSWEGVECINYSPLVYAYGATNVAITGKGTLAPRIDGWVPWFRREAPPQREAVRVIYKWSLGGVPIVERNLWKLDAHARPHLIHLNRCKGVRLVDFRVRQSPFWCVHLYRSQDIVVRGLDISAMRQNNDGVDIEMSRNVTIENCHFNQGDDAIVLKAGRNREAYLTGEPTENVTIRNCTADKALTFITIGSEISGSVRHVRAYDCRARAVDKVIHIKTNERRGGEICDIDYRHIHCNSARIVVVIQADAMYDEWKRIPSEDVAPTSVHDIVLSDVTCGTADFLGEIRGDARKPFGVISVSGVRANLIQRADGWQVAHAPAFKEMLK